MKATELIKHLQAIVDEHGDLNVINSEPGDGFYVNCVCSFGDVVNEKWIETGTEYPKARLSPSR